MAIASTFGECADRALAENPQFRFCRGPSVRSARAAEFRCAGWRAVSFRPTVRSRQAGCAKRAAAARATLAAADRAVGAERCHLAGAGGAPVRGAQRRARRFRIVAVAPSRNRDRATSRRSVKTGVHRERSFRARCCSGRGQTWPRRKDASGAWCPPRHSGRTCQPRRAKTSGACGQAAAASDSRGKPQEALVKLESRAVVPLEGRVLFGFV